MACIQCIIREVKLLYSEVFLPQYVNECRRITPAGSKSSRDILQRCILPCFSLPGHSMQSKQTMLYISMSPAASLNASTHLVTVLNVRSVMGLKKSKGKGLPRQAEVAQGVSGSLRHQIFLTFRHYKGGRSSAKRTGRLYPRRNPWYSLSEAESTSGHMVLSGEPRKKSPVTPPGIDPGTF